MVADAAASQCARIAASSSREAPPRRPAPVSTRELRLRERRACRRSCCSVGSCSEELLRGRRRAARAPRSSRGSASPWPADVARAGAGSAGSPIDRADRGSRLERSREVVEAGQERRARGPLPGRAGATRRDRLRPAIALLEEARVARRRRACGRDVLERVGLERHRRDAGPGRPKSATAPGGGERERGGDERASASGSDQSGSRPREALRSTRRPARAPRRVGVRRSFCSAGNSVKHDDPVTSSPTATQMPISRIGRICETPSAAKPTAVAKIDAVHGGNLFASAKTWCVVDGRDPPGARRSASGDRRASRWR